MSFFLIQLNLVWILVQWIGFFPWIKTTTPPVRKKNHLRVLSDVAIYPCIDIPYGLNEKQRVEEILKFNPTKGLGVRHDFTILIKK
jgi:hypothetical protein